MSPPEPLGPFCQSCGMPLGKPEDFGTDHAGYRVNDYCRHCFAGGEFTDPDVTLPKMIDHCAGVMSARGIMPEMEARVLMSDVLPRMKRWRRRGTKKVF